MKIKLLIILLVMFVFPKTAALAQDNASIAFASPKNDEIWFGKIPIEVKVQNSAQDLLQTVEIYLDGKSIKELKNPPYSFHYDFGTIPQNSSLRAVLRINGKIAADTEIKSMPIDDIQEVDVTQILVPVVVTDSEGNYVSNLKKEDFTLLEENVPQNINNFSKSGKTDFHLTLLIDISSSMKDKITEVKKAAKEFLQRLLSKNDKAAVVFFNHDVFEDTEFSNDLSELSNSISMAFPFGATALYDAVGYCLKLLKGMPGLNIIIIFSDGEDNSSFMDPYTLIKKAERSNTIIYAIGSRTASYNNEYQEILKKLSSSSGGILFFIENTSEVQKMYELIRRDIKAEYVLEFSPKKHGAGKRFRGITVKIPGKRYNIRTIKGYYY